MSLSLLLFLATGVLWVRSIGHVEAWTINCFEAHPEWSTRGFTGVGIWRRWYLAAICGRIWFSHYVSEPAFASPDVEYTRDTCSAQEAKDDFESSFTPGSRPWKDGSQQSWQFAGLGVTRVADGIDRQLGRPGIHGVAVAIPFWMLALLFALWPGIAIPRRVVRWRRRRKRLRDGLCLGCGYDLRATPDPAGPRVDRCPECGRQTRIGAGGA